MQAIGKRILIVSSITLFALGGAVYQWGGNHHNESLVFDARGLPGRDRGRGVHGRGLRRRLRPLPERRHLGIPVIRARSAACIAAALLALLAVSGCGKKKLDYMLFASEPASLDDYDFTREDLDGIDPARITSELIPSAKAGVAIHVVYIERDAAKLDPRIPAEAGVTVLVSHGTGSNILGYFYRAAYFEEMGFNVLIYDYRGYGASGGETTEAHLYEDAATAYDYTTGKDGVGAVVAYGFSLGGGPTIWLCSPESGRDVLACVTESTFTSAEDFFADFRTDDGWYVEAEIDNEARIAGVTLPFFLMHGEEDKIVKISHGHALFAAVEGNNPLDRFAAVAGAGHADVPLPSLDADMDPATYSHPDELPADLYEEFAAGYAARFNDFVADALGY